MSDHLAPDQLAELDELEARATPGQWKLYTSNSWRRIGVALTYHEILWPTTHQWDRHPDLAGPNVDNDLALLIALRNAWPQLRRVTRWISVEERLPHPFVNVPVVAWGGKAKGLAHVTAGDEPLWVDATLVDYHSSEIYIDDVTHWFDLPAAPAELVSTQRVAK